MKRSKGCFPLTKISVNFIWDASRTRLSGSVHREISGRCRTSRKGSPGRFPLHQKFRCEFPEFPVAEGTLYINLRKFPFHFPFPEFWVERLAFGMDNFRISQEIPTPFATFSKVPQFLVGWKAPTPHPVFPVALFRIEIRDPLNISYCLFLLQAFRLSRPLASTKTAVASGKLQVVKLIFPERKFPTKISGSFL